MVTKPSLNVRYAPYKIPIIQLHVLYELFKGDHGRIGQRVI